MISTLQALVLERKSRSLARLLTTAIFRLEILLGHYLAIFLMILARFLLLMLFGQLFLGLDYFGQPLASLLLALATAAFTGCLGLLIGALAQTEEQVIIYLFAGTDVPFCRARRRLGVVGVHACGVPACSLFDPGCLVDGRL